MDFAVAVPTSHGFSAHSVAIPLEFQKVATGNVGNMTFVNFTFDRHANKYEAMALAPFNG